MIQGNFYITEWVVIFFPFPQCNDVQKIWHEKGYTFPLKDSVVLWHINH